jgi:hypothetical protein
MLSFHDNRFERKNKVTIAKLIVLLFNLETIETKNMKYLL